MVDLTQLIAAITGKVELVYEGEEEGTLKVARHLIGEACQAVFDRHFPDAIREGSEDGGGGARRKGGKGKGQAVPEEPKLKSDRYKPVLDWFAAGNRLELSDDMPDARYIAALEAVPGLGPLVDEFLAERKRPVHPRASRAAAMELILEGLHQHSLLAKEDVDRKISYSDMLGLMLEGLK
jgi:magnesium chelatase subunit I